MPSAKTIGGLDTLKSYILSDKPEEQKRHLAYEYFKGLFRDDFKTEENKSDIYIDRQLVVETKTHASDFLAGFYQALHYQKKGLAFSAVSVIAHKFMGLWKVNDIPAEAKEVVRKSDALKSASETGVINANKTSKALQKEILKSATFLLTEADLTGFFLMKWLTRLFPNTRGSMASSSLTATSASLPCGSCIIILKSASPSITWCLTLRAAAATS